MNTLNKLDYISGLFTVLIYANPLKKSATHFALKWFFMALSPFFSLSQGIIDLCNNYRISTACDTDAMQEMCNTMKVDHPCCKGLTKF